MTSQKPSLAAAYCSKWQQQCQILGSYFVKTCTLEAEISEKGLTQWKVFISIDKNISGFFDKSFPLTLYTLRVHLQILLCLMPDDFACQRETP